MSLLSHPVMPYLEKERKTSGDKAVMSLITVLYLVSSVWATYKKVFLHKTRRRVSELAMKTGQILSAFGKAGTRERQDEPEPYKKALEITLLVGKMVVFTIARYGPSLTHCMH